MIQPSDIRIATILTCHDRCAKTVKCMESLKQAVQYFHTIDSRRLLLEVFLTDDGCTDNTVAAVTKTVGDTFPLHIIKGDGNLFWSNGMVAAWREAHKTRDWDFYLLLNDDTNLFKNSIEELFDTHAYCLEEYGKAGIYSGITCDTADENVITYGGSVWINKFLGTKRLLSASDKPQLCDITNANILLVAKDVVDSVGIFHDGYLHSAADEDYAVQVRKNGFPALVSAKVCGSCDFDHKDTRQTLQSLCKMSLKERKAYFRNPLHSTHDQLTFIRRCTPGRYPFVLVGRFVNLYFPKLYLLLDKRKK